MDEGLLCSRRKSNTAKGLPKAMSLRIGEAVAKAFVKPRLPDQGTTGFNDAGPGATLGEPLQLLNPK